MDVPVRLDLRRFVERSNGVFGKSGTGKSFLTRLLLCGVIKSGAAVNLIFDMHSEYGWNSQSEDGHEVKGLRSSSARVTVYTLDMRIGAASAACGRTARSRSGCDEIDVDDIALLHDELQLNPTAVESAAPASWTSYKGGNGSRRLIDMDARGARATSARAHGANAGVAQRRCSASSAHIRSRCRSCGSAPRDRRWTR